MRWKAIALTAFAVGYVLGAQAGRQRYEQIRNLAIRFKDDPHVRHAAHGAAEAAKAEAGPLVDKVSATLHSTGNHRTHREPVNDTGGSATSPHSGR